MAEKLDLRQHIQNELVRRCRANSSYSLRAFARDLNVDPSTLSQFIRQKRNLSVGQQSKLCNRLGLDPEVARDLSLESPVGQVTSLPLDIFEVIADWYHYAIFELSSLVDFQEEPRWISARLGITLAEARHALERLERLELLVRDRGGRLQQGTDLISTTKNEFTAAAFRLLQAQLLELAKQAMTSIPLERRDQTSMTMAIDLNDIPFAKERIKRFRRKLCADLQKKRKRNAVYQLLISFFPLTDVPSLAPGGFNEK